ncbi:MAG: CRISPR-associated protein Csc2 [Thermoplasmatales archaeon I-plasma]|nr:MAG: CRISPR-associated protein Csc2 [Thermoplasmatales archaeon I-plasma]
MEGKLLKEVIKLSSKIGTELMSILGKQYFTTEKINDIPALCQNNPKNVTILVIRETISPFIDRSDVPDESIWFRMPDGRNVIQVPARKFKSKEKIFGIKLLRLLGMVDSGYRYNHLTSRQQFRNPTSILMGETIVNPVKGEDTLSVPARALYTDVYSLRDREYITRKLTNNALNEERTMYDKDKGKTSSAFFQTEEVNPGTFFPALITIKDPTPELLLHMILSLQQTSYGASSATMGANFRNHIVGIVGSIIEPPVSSYLISYRFGQTVEKPTDVSTLTFEYVKKTLIDIETEMLTDGASILTGDKVNDLVNYIKSLKLQGDEIKEAYEVARKDIDEYIDFSFELKKNKRSGRKNNPNTPSSGSDKPGNIQTGTS